MQCQHKKALNKEKKKCKLLSNILIVYDKYQVLYDQVMGNNLIVT